MSDSPAALPFTGERFTPECVREIWYEHWHRYAFALDLVRGKRVLDAACGEGYGSNLLADAAASVVGVDLSAQAVDHARNRYGSRTNLQFVQADATALPFEDARFDVVVSFETLEHLHAQERLIEGFARVLADDGLLVISSPDKRTYSDVMGFDNEFHVRELYRDELLDLLRPHFPQLRLYGQKLLFQSALWSLDGADGDSQAWTSPSAGQAPVPGLGYAPVYYVALCGRRGLPAPLPALSLFGDGEESVYAHYNHEVRKNMAAGARIAELEAELDRLRQDAGPAAPEPLPAPRGWRRWLR
ncbi:class I SAM-dependent methyltransferase [Dokdonella koreensis]|uniref:Family 2 glycosyl transferase n=1 Tax=Dokdonella koreensis DS-123 TaxID=1300342 RepID=A0A160DRZ1_9GAMM|nr:class I SAM-dependent methyltransferase [Dokdonella koreensis]ANB16804.1 Family 2 glycosyl transferase [Dokdonella koreensis DS-123]